MSKSPTLQDLCAVVSQHAECLAHLSTALNRWWPEPQEFWKGHITLDTAFCDITLRAVGPATQKEATTGHGAIPAELLQKLGGPGARVLVRGNSGAGKSMLGRWLAWQSIQEIRRHEEFLDTESRSGSPIAAFPLIVSLAKYAETVRKQSENCSLEEFVLQHATVPDFPSSVPTGIRARAERLARTYWAEGKVLVVLEELESGLLANEHLAVGEKIGSATIRSAVRDFIDALPPRHSLLALSRAGWPKEWPEIDQYELQPLTVPQRRELLARTILMAGKHLDVDTTAVLSDLEHGILGSPHGNEWLKRASDSPEIAALTAALAVTRSAKEGRSPPLATAFYDTFTDLKLQRWAERWLQCLPAGLQRTPREDFLKYLMQRLASNSIQAGHAVFTADADASALDLAEFDSALRPLLEGSQESPGECQQLLANLRLAVVYDSGLLVLKQGKIEFQTPGMRRHLANVSGGTHTTQPAPTTISAAEVRQVALDFAEDQSKEILRKIKRSAEGRVKSSGRIASQEESIPPLIPGLEVPPPGSSVLSPSSRSTIKKDAIRYLAKVRESLCMVGDPGVGKSIALMMTARELCECLRERRWLYRWLRLSWWRHKVPIFIELGRFTRSEVQLHSRQVGEYVREQLILKYGPEAPILRVLDDLEATGKVVWIFDAVDEVSRKRHGDHVQALSDFASKTGHMGDHCLFSCRTNDLTIFDLPGVKLAGFDEAQMVQFLEKWFAGDITIDHKPWEPADLARELRSGNRAALPPESVGNPFLLKLFCAFVARSGTWPASRVIMLQTYLEDAFLYKKREAEKRSNTPADLIEMQALFFELARIAHRISELGDGPFASLHRLYDGTPEGRSGVDGVIGTARRCGILAAPANEADDLVGFEHHRYDEFFSALYLHTAIESIDWMDKLESPRWLEIMQNLILLGGAKATAPSSASALAVQVLTDSLSRDADEHEDIVAARIAQGDALSEGDHAGDLLDDKRETQWAFRAEVAARIVGQASGAIAAVRDILTPATRRSLEFLITYGHDETKVRLALVAVHLPVGKDAEPLKALDRMAASPCEWVRNHDFELMVTSPAYRKLSEGRPDIHCVALSEMRFLAHSKKAKVALQKRPDKASIKGWRQARLIYRVLNTGLVLLLTLMALAGPFFPTYWHWGPQWWEPINSAFGYWSSYWVSIAFGVFCGLGVISLQLNAFGSWVKRAWATRSFRQRWEWDSLDRWFQGALTGGLVFFRLVALAVTFLMSLAIFDVSWPFFVVWLALYVLLYLSLEAWRYAAVLWRAFMVLFLYEGSSPLTEDVTRPYRSKYFSKVWTSCFPGRGFVHSIFLVVCSIAGFVGVMFLPYIFGAALQNKEQLDASITGTARQVGHFLASIWHGVATPVRPFTNIFATLWQDIVEYYSRSEETALKCFKRLAEMLSLPDFSLSGYTLKAIFSWAVTALVLSMPLGYYFLSRKKEIETVPAVKPSVTANSRVTSVLAQIGWLILRLASLLLLFAFITVAAKSKAPPILYGSVWLTIIVVLIIGYLVEKDVRDKRASGVPTNPKADWVRRMWIAFSIGTVASTIYFAKRKPEKPPEPSNTTITVICILGGIALAVLLVVLLRGGSRRAVVTWRKYRSRRGLEETPDLHNWLNHIRRGNPNQQRKLLQLNLDHLRLSTEKMLEVLLSIRSVIKAEPARSAFGEKLHQVLDKWRHEKMTNQDRH